MEISKRKSRTAVREYERAFLDQQARVAMLDHVGKRAPVTLAKRTDDCILFNSKDVLGSPSHTRGRSTDRFPSANEHSPFYRYIHINALRTSVARPSQYERFRSENLTHRFWRELAASPFASGCDKIVSRRQHSFCDFEKRLPSKSESELS